MNENGHRKPENGGKNAVQQWLDEEAELEKRECRYKKCRKPFIPTRKNQYYHEPRCSTRHRLEKLRKRKLRALVQSVRCAHGHPGVRIPGEIDLRK